jgi:hypothetical protein
MILGEEEKNNSHSLTLNSNDAIQMIENEEM